MAAVIAPPPGVRRVSSFRIRNRREPSKRFVVSVMKDGSEASSGAEEEGISGDLPMAPIFPQFEMSSSQRNLAPSIPKPVASSNGSNLRFDRPRPSNDEFNWEHQRVFGRYVAREALLGEELWTAAWLRAESHWENSSDVRHVETYKRQFAEREFNALTRRCNKQLAEKCVCIIGVKNDERNGKHTVLNSIVGTLDLTVRHLLSGETFPGERIKQPASCSIYRADQPKYAYVSNLCVAKHSRRRGIASNMLLLAIEAATSYGTNQIFVHVHKDNFGAQKLYDQIGFQVYRPNLTLKILLDFLSYIQRIFLQIVEAAVPHLMAENKHLLYLNI
ncbi:hypothetical protein Cni_G11354 [Canna indica]|uniref:N-acetyltransferase domain-containing protein n=1 Tax=Canna indica TaxID=4628 RepID=A0AAQ3K648_9LILI|nr:hypothetical protein Cni_G11354 [Canna indica]